ncbi:Alpha/Beta hydrolase protein [Apodospora peruviana]|uniref:Alpha/Beta hydrolase protein n=1 Tax=Apodospora peruviana TaxID=516989 RepID=A0AAE0IDC1_9PEZI|nr:Alpha/Beta hydrolase protein [Apodospora peruviana]
MALAYSYCTLPANITVQPVPFTFHVPRRDLLELGGLVSVAKIPPSSWYIKHDDGEFGISRDWLAAAKNAWIDDFSWSTHEEKLNSYPNFKVNITTDEAGVFSTHFAALFSKKADATPVIFLHGWPGSYMEFFPMMDLLVQKYTPETLPYHVIVPSIPDYGFSSGPSADVELTFPLAGEVMNKLMISLGFNAYIAQGGDVGSFMATQMCGTYDECKAWHINMLFLQADQMLSLNDTTPDEREHIAFAKTWSESGSAYAYEHGTRPATISLVLSTSPLAMLTWIGEKFIQWVDQRAPLPLDTILAMVTFYWVTDTFPRSMWPYRFLTGIVGAPIPAMPFSLTKPFGFSSFPIEQSVLPQKWAEQLFPNLIFFGKHLIGGHFAALEQPVAFLEDVEEFIARAKQVVKI